MEDALRMTIGQGVVTKDLWDAIEEDIRRRRDIARECLDQFCKSRALRLLDTPKSTTSASAAWRDVEGKFSAEIGSRGRFHELIVLSRGDDQFGATTAELGDILIQSGRPMLLAPRTGDVHNVFGTIAIAWKDTAESARAMTAAMPFIEAADRVVLLTVSEGEDNSAAIDSTEKLAVELRWHGIEPEIRCLSPRSRSVGETLIDAAENSGANLLVLGGYGHSRAREFVLGGVTRYMFESADFPTLIAH